MTENQSEALRAILSGGQLPTEMAWDALLEMGRRYGLSALLYWRLREGRPPQFPEASQTSNRVAEWRALRRGYQAAVVREMLVARQWREVLSALNQAGLRPLPLKGAAIAQCYPRPELRAYGDLDILLPREEISRAKEALEHLGYRSRKPAMIWSLERLKHLPPMWADKCLDVELHWRLDLPGETGHVPIEGVWARAGCGTLYGVGVWRMDPVDEALYLCRHGVIQHRLVTGVRACCDLFYLTRDWDNTQWEALVARARLYELERPLYLLLALAGRVSSLSRAGETVMWDLETALSVEPGFVERMQAMMLRDRAVPGVPIALVRAAQKPFWARLRWVLFRAFPPPRATAQIYTLPDRSPLLALCYLWRPLDLLRENAGQTWRLVRGERSARRVWAQERELEDWLGVERPW